VVKRDWPVFVWMLSSGPPCGGLGKRRPTILKKKCSGQ